MTRLTSRDAAQAIAAPVEHDWYRIENAAKKGSEPSAADVFVYGTIGGSWFDEGPSAAQFVQDIAALDVDTINLYVNSPGGSVYDGISMRNALIRHPANVIAHVDGMAASAASFLITAGNEVVMGPNTEIMIHDAMSYAGGNAADLRAVAITLDGISDNIASMYAQRAGGDPADWRALMIAETWYTADEAVAAGIADRVADLPSPSSADAAENRFDLSVFAYAGRGQAPRPAALADIAAIRAQYPTSGEFLDRIAVLANAHRPQRPAEPGSSTPTPTEKGADQMVDLKKEFANRLGIPEAEVANMSDETILAAFDEALNERAETPEVTATLPEGTVVVDSTVLADLQRQAAAGAEARAEQFATRRAGIVDAALAKGKITANSRQMWLDNLEKNEEGTTAILDSLPENKVLPTAEYGFTGGVDDATDNDARTMAALGWGDDDSEGK